LFKLVVIAILPNIFGEICIHARWVITGSCIMNLRKVYLLLLLVIIWTSY